MVPHTRQEIIAIDILSNNLGSQDNQAIKFDQLIELFLRTIFLQNHAETEVKRLVPSLYFLKFYIRYKQVNKFWYSST